MASQQQATSAFSTEHLHKDLRGRSVRGGMLTLTSQGAQFVIQTVGTVVLARLLAPAEYGLVAMVTAITGLGQAFADLGLSEATIQHPEITHDQVSTLFWINVAIGAGLMSITAALAPLLAWFYHEPRLINITLVCSVTFLIGGLRVQHDALLRRQMRFVSLAIRDVISYAVAVPLAICLALRGAGYWAIVVLPLTLNFTGMVFSWVMARWIPGMPRRDANIRPLISFGGSVAASYLVMTFTRSADSILIGWHWGAGPLGLYSRACNLLMLPVRQLGAPARSVAVPAFSRVQDDPERIARFYLRTVNVVMWVSAPLFGYLFVAAEPVIAITLGKRWHEAAPVFQLLAILALGQLLMDATGWLLVSQRKVIAPLADDPHPRSHNDCRLRDRPSIRHSGRGTLQFHCFRFGLSRSTQVQFSRHEDYPTPAGACHFLPNLAMPRGRSLRGISTSLHCLSRIFFPTVGRRSRILARFRALNASA